MDNKNNIPKYPQKNFDHAATAVDVVLFTVSERELKVLLLKLKEKPFEGRWALPGGLVAKGETLDQAAYRHLENKAGIRGKVHIEQLYTFGDPKRDPLGWVVSVSYLALVNSQKYHPQSDSRYETVQWQPVESLPNLAYDHKEIIDTGVKRLKGKLMYTNIIFSLMPKEFTLTDLQNMYEIIMNKNLDKRNFRKKILSLNILKELKRKSISANRPATLYTFKSHNIEEMNLI